MSFYPPQHPKHIPEPSERSPGSEDDGYDDKDGSGRANGGQANSNHPNPGPALSLDTLFPSGQPNPNQSLPPQLIQPGQPIWSNPPPQLAVASPSGSDDNEPSDPLRPANASAPWANMLHLAEAARLKADSHIVKEDAVDDLVTTPEDGRVAKRPRTKSNVGDHRSPTHTSLLERGNHLTPDPVDLGWCTEQRGRELFDM
ncbi:hypothetical protein IAU60_003036 [Kwoniella sp. DSM 27419]